MNIIEYNPWNGELRIINQKDNINSIISEWNKKKDKFTGFSKNTFKVSFVIHESFDYDENFNMTNSATRKMYLFAQDYLKHDNQPKVPIIHFTIDNIFLNDDAYRYKKVIDSSIWNYYLQLERGKTINKLKEAIKQIGHYYDEKRYSLGVAHEYCDLNARIVEQSHLYEKSPHDRISPFLFHSENEMRDKLQRLGLNGEICNTNRVIDEAKKYKWRILLLDDKGISKMSGLGNKKVDICKLQIISKNLHHILEFTEERIWFRNFDFQSIRNSNKNRRIIEEKSHRIIEKSDEPQIQCGRVKDISWNSTTDEYIIVNSEITDYSKDFQIVIDCVKHVDAAEYCLQKYIYDIVLIDYLLDIDKIKKEKEYGYILLKNLYDWYRKKQNEETKNMDKTYYNVGPNNGIAIMFISAFTTAVHERILEMGLDMSEQGLWYIGDGASPTNTPYLFSYQLLQLMRHRIKDLKKETEGGELAIIDILEEIYVKTKPSDLQNVREKAYNHFNHLLFMRDKYKRLVNDLDKGDEMHLKQIPKDYTYMMNMKSSLLVYSAFKLVHHFSEAFFDHLQHLVYLTAYGTIRQWQDMWEEYVFIYNELFEYDKYVVEYDEDKNVRNRGKKICNAIKEYIINLKENSI